MTILKGITKTILGILQPGDDIVAESSQQDDIVLPTFQCSTCGQRKTLLICGQCYDCAKDIHEWGYERLKLTSEQKREIREATGANNT